MERDHDHDHDTHTCDRADLLLPKRIYHIATTDRVQATQVKIAYVLTKSSS